MHIALLTDGITPYVTGGMQRHSFHLARHLLKLGVEVTLVHCVPNDSSVPSEDEIKDLLGATSGLTVHGLNFPKAGRFPGHYLRESYRFSCEIYELLKNEWNAFDFIYAKGFTSWCLLEKKRKGVHMCPVGVKFHGYEMFQPVNDLKGKAQQHLLKPPVVFINREADVVFSYGGAITDIITSLGVPREKIVPIGSGIDDHWLREEIIPEKKPRKFLFIGRNERRKGIADLHACAEYLEAAPIEFHWVGPILPLQRLAGENMVYHGEIKDPQALKDIIDKCQVLVTPSHAEGMPNVILEAMSRGLAIIATDVGAVPMMVRAENGILIPPKRKKALSDALREMAEKPSGELDRMRERSLAIVREQFLWSSVARQTLDAIKKSTFTT